MYYIYFSNEANGTIKEKDDCFSGFANKKTAQEMADKLNRAWESQTTFHWVE
jgi:hypothetical protein